MFPIKEEVSDLSLTYYDDGSLKITERVIHIHPYQTPKKEVKDQKCSCAIL